MSDRGDHEPPWYQQQIDFREVSARLLAQTSRNRVRVTMGLGAALRLGAYLQCRIPSMDENSLTSNIVGRSAQELFGELGFGQLAPPGFLTIERLEYLLLGRSWWSLRLIPLLFGLATLPLMWAVAPLPGGMERVACPLAVRRQW